MFFVSSMGAQSLNKESYRMDTPLSPGIAGNSINDLLVRGDTLYAASDEGLAFTRDYGHTWSRYTHENGIGKGGISALDVRNGVVWISTGFDTLIDHSHLPAGGGVGYSEDHGRTWHWFRQPMDSVHETGYKPTTTHVQNNTYDLAITENTVWIASFGGGLRKSDDMGKTWQVVTVDNAPFDALGKLSHRVFSVLYDQPDLWVGSAGGVHRSSDSGLTWKTFSHQNQEYPISGNFVVALGKQKTAEKNIIWAATWPTTTESGDTTEFKAVSKSEDDGLTWKTMLKNESAHNFAFHESVVYVATDNGVYMSPDYGETWAVYPAMYDEQTNRTIYDLETGCVTAGPRDALWIGTSDGLGMTRNNGLTWTVFQVYVSTHESDEPETYACPNPFSPSRDRRLNDAGHCRFVYSVERPAHVTVTVYDFGMNLVTSLEYEAVSPGLQSEPVWTGRNDLGNQVANGVYFYRVQVSGEGTYWGKVIVVD